MKRLWRELLFQARWALPLWAVCLLTAWLPDNRIATRIRGALARPFVGRCGRNFRLGGGVTILNSHRLTVGDDVYIARGAWLNCLGGLEFQNEVVVGPYCVISTLQHVAKAGSFRRGGSIARPVRLSVGCWVAGHVSVKAGVTVGRGALVAANAAVVKDVPDGVMVAGVPARVISAVREVEAEFFKRSDL